MRACYIDLTSHILTQKLAKVFEALQMNRLFFCVCACCSLRVSVVLFHSCNLHSPLHSISSPLSSFFLSFPLMTVLYYCAVHRSAGGWNKVRSHLSNILENARAGKEVSPFKHRSVKGVISRLIKFSLIFWYKRASCATKTLQLLRTLWEMSTTLKLQRFHKETVHTEMILFLTPMTFFFCETYIKRIFHTVRVSVVLGPLNFIIHSQKKDTALLPLLTPKGSVLLS